MNLINKYKSIYTCNSNQEKPTRILNSIKFDFKKSKELEMYQN